MSLNYYINKYLNLVEKGKPTKALFRELKEEGLWGKFQRVMWG